MVMLRDTALAAPDPALSSLWQVMIPYANGKATLFAETVSLTWFKIPAEGHLAGGRHLYFPGYAEVDGLAISFYETHDHKVGNWLQAWQKLIYNPETEVYGLPKDYKQTITVNLFSRFSSNAAKIVTYTGCWPTDRGPYELTYSDETGRIVIQAQFACDKQV